MIKTDQKEFPAGYHGKKMAKWGIPTREDLEPANRRVRVFTEFVQSLPRDAKVLDVGCGNGKAARRILGLRPDIMMYGIDTGDLSGYLPEDVVFTQGSAEELRKYYDTNFFDAVICQHLIEHLLYPMDLIEGIKSVLKPGGRLYLETPNWTRLYAPFSDIWFWNDYTHIRPYAKKTLHRLFNESGLRVLALTSCSSFMLFPRRGKTVAEEQVNADQPRLLQGQFRRGLFARIFNRIVNPFLLDVLIGIAEKSAQ